MQNTFNSFNLLNKVDLTIQTISNPFLFKMEDLFLLGARVNPKRSFLFISKLLGKHLEVHPDVPKLSGHLLANLFSKKYEGKMFSNQDVLINAVKTGQMTDSVKYELSKQLPLTKDVLFLGFAETATGIGHAVFSAFKNAHYVHTTREQFIDKESVFDFQEEHSHATDHLCYLKDKTLFENVPHIVLIDDEITTGNTCLNLIRSLNEIYPNKQYTILSLLDWRTDEQVEQYEQFKKTYRLNIDTMSVIRGAINVERNHTFEQKIDKQKKAESVKPYQTIYDSFDEKVEVERERGMYEEMLLATGRFGLTSHEAENIEEEAKRIGKDLSYLRKGKKTLIVGNGEFMYVPSRIASYMGEGVSYKSSTRSPIYVSDKEGYPIHDKIEFKLENGVVNYLYNLKDSGFDEVMFFIEGTLDTVVMSEISEAIQSKGISEVKFIGL